jgi:DNA-binding IclR family transcriptional regulator
MAETKRIRVVERAIDVMFVLSSHGGRLGLTAIAKQVELANATVLRILASLEAKGLVGYDSARKEYHLTSKVLHLAAGSAREFTGAAAAELEELSRTCHQAATLYLRDGAERLCLLRVNGESDIVHNVKVGTRLPLHRGSPGKAILAWLPEPDLQATLMSCGVKDIEGFKLSLAQDRAQQYASSRNERGTGIASIAAPVLDGKGTAVGAVSLSGATERLDDATLESYSPHLISAASKISFLFQMLGL